MIDTFGFMHTVVVLRTPDTADIIIAAFSDAGDAKTYISRVLHDDDAYVVRPIGEQVRYSRAVGAVHLTAKEGCSSDE